MRPLLFIILAISYCCSLSFDREKQDLKKALRLNLSSPPPSLDPRKAADLISNNLVHMLFEGLTKLDSQGQAKLAIAKSVKISSDQKNFLFELKKTHWSDGKELSAYEFEKSWKQRLSKDFPSQVPQQMYLIKNARKAKLGLCETAEIGVKSLSETTLEIELEHPCPYFLQLLACHCFFPVKDEKALVGNGPFLLKKHKALHKICLNKNPYFWEAENVKLETVDISFVPDSMTEIYLFENDELDWAGAPFSKLSSDALPNLLKEPTFSQIEAAGTYCYKFNTKKAPFNNSKMRKAFSYALKREQIVKHITQGLETPVTGSTPTAMALQKKPFFKDGNLEKAKALFLDALKELKMEQKDIPSITLSFNSSEEHQKIAQAVQQQWQNAFGIPIILENSEWQIYLEKLKSGDYQVGRMSWFADVGDPIEFLELFKYADDEALGGNNQTRWENTKYQRLLEESFFAKTKEERNELLLRAENILIDEMPFAPLFSINFSYLKKEKLRGVNFSPLGFVDLRYAYKES